MDDSLKTETLNWTSDANQGRAFLSGAGVLRRPLRGKAIRIGRASTNQVSPQGAGLSKHHAELRKEPEGWSITDLGSRNGTFVGGARIERALLPDRAELRFGGAVMWFELEAAERLVEKEALPGLIGGDLVMLELARLVRRVAPTQVPVLVLGETGVGKEKVAQNLHDLSGRRGDFIPINCGSFSPELVGAELFGAVRGAYTGADRDRIGAFAAAQGGTLFLDEIGELPLAVQVQLLRCIESGTIRRLGEARERAVDVRIVAATHRDLEAMMADKTFRADLVHRLAVFPLRIAPLRDRPGDIAAIAVHLLASFDAEKRFHADALVALKHHHWPGNVRELRNLITRAAILAEGTTLHAQDLALKAPRIAGTEVPLRHEKNRLALGICAGHGNLSETARQLGMARSSLYRQLKRIGWDQLDREALLARAEATIAE
jgi:DNA-binding NtrC family response regulator